MTWRAHRHTVHRSWRQKARQSHVTGHRRLRERFKVWQSSTEMAYPQGPYEQSFRRCAISWRSQQLQSITSLCQRRSQTDATCFGVLLLFFVTDVWTLYVQIECCAGSTGTAFGLTLCSLHDVSSYTMDQRTVVTYCMQQGQTWEADRFSACQQIPHISCNPKVQYRCYNSPPPDPVLSQRTVSASNKTGKNYTLKNWTLYSVQGTSLGPSKKRGQNGWEM